MALNNVVNNMYFQQIKGTTDWVTLNVGGTKFETKLSTLTSVPNSLLAKMVSSSSSSPSKPCHLCSSQNNVASCKVSCPHRADDLQVLSGTREIHIDSNPACFSVILDYLRYGSVVVPPSLPPALLSKAAAALGLQELVVKLQQGAAGGSNRESDGREREVTRSKEWLKLNVGGKIFETSRATLTSHPSSSLAKMFEPKSKLCPAIMDGGVYQLDACPRAFSVLLNWLRYRRLMLGPAIRAEEVVPVADFFGLGDLNSALADHIRKEEERSLALVEMMESSTERLEEVLQQVQGELSNAVDKLDDIKMEVASVATNTEELWRIKNTISIVAGVIRGDKEGLGGK